MRLRNFVYAVLGVLFVVWFVIGICLPVVEVAFHDTRVKSYEVSNMGKCASVDFEALGKFVRWRLTVIGYFRETCTDGLDRTEVSQVTPNHDIHVSKTKENDAPLGFWTTVDGKIYESGKSYRLKDTPEFIDVMTAANKVLDAGVVCSRGPYTTILWKLTCGITKGAD